MNTLQFFVLVLTYVGYTQLDRQEGKRPAHPDKTKEVY